MSSELENSSFNIIDVSRPLANFHPCPWGDYFLSCDSNTSLEEKKMVEKQVQELKEEVRRMLVDADKASDKLSLIDSIQRLGLSHHFEGEIDEILKYMLNSISGNGDDHEDLNNTALRFRLLRQQGYYISCELFNKFTNTKGNFKESLVNDERGILSLYEASHLRIHGESILDEALDFTTTKLKAIAMDSSSCFKEAAKYALKWPIFKAFPRLMAKDFISFYDKDPSYNSVLLKFAKMDFNILQKLYQKEMAELTRWWKDLNLIQRLSFARNRSVESYVWALGVFYEPKYSLGRRILAKVITFLAVLDDMYDAYASFEELQLFTDAIERWDINAIDELPEYMKICYEAFFDIYREIQQIVSKDKLPFATLYIQQAIKRQCRVYLTEAKWFQQGYVPIMEEYMKVAMISTCYHIFPPISFLCMEEASSKEAFKWIESDPMLLKAAGIIGRLQNDINSHKFEQDRGHVASAVECYMKLHQVSEQEALLELKKQVVRAWKDIIKDYMESINIPNSILDRVLNLARITDLFYKEGDGYSFSDGLTKRFITFMLTDPVPV